MTKRQRTALTAELERIYGSVEGWADVLDPERKPRAELREDVRILVTALDQIGTQASRALTHIRLGHA